MHIIGGEISYECLGDVGTSKRYRFTMKVYRDCYGGGAEFDNPAKVAIYRGTENQSTLFASFDVSNPSIRLLVPEIPECVAEIPNVCVEEAIYRFDRVLPVSPQSYFIVYQRCCRNITINNILYPGDIGATYAIELTPAAQQVCNNSPVYNNFPPVIICKDFPISFDHSATDADGDSLVYRFCSPLQGGGPILSPPTALKSCFGAAPEPPCPPPFDIVPFISPFYSETEPIASNPIITVDPITGLMAGKPNLLGQFVAAVCVEEYRNGQLLSTVRREFQFNVADCSPSVVANIYTDSIAGPKHFVVTSCGQNTITFQNLSARIEFINTYQWNFDLKGTPFVNTTNWDVTVPFPDTGSYNGTLYLNPGLPCGDTAFIKVNIFPAITADFSFAYDTCTATPVQFTDHSYGDGGVNRWSWNFGVPNATSTDQHPSFLYPYPGVHQVRLRAYDANNCHDDAIQTIHWYPVPPLILLAPSKLVLCVPDTVTFTNLSAPIDSTYHIVWDFGDGTQVEDIISPTHIYTTPGVYDVSVKITSPVGCYIEDEFPDLILGKPSPVANFSYQPDTLLSNLINHVQFFDESIDAYRWNWMFDNLGTSNQENPEFTFQDTGLMRIRLLVTHQSGCQDSIVKHLDIVPDFRWYMPNAFTPNADGQNDEFHGVGLLEGVTGFKMTIWNRWGEMVFETDDPTESWSGYESKSGKLSPPGVYVYLVTFVSPRGKPLEYKGFATLVR